SGILALACSSDGKRIAASGEDEAIWVWDLNTGKEITASGHRVHVQSIGFSVDGRTLITAGADGMFCTWDTRSGQSRSCFTSGVRMRLRAVACSPGGKYVAFAGMGGEIGVWDAVRGRRAFLLRAHEGTVFRLAF